MAEKVADAEEAAVRLLEVLDRLDRHLRADPAEPLRSQLDRLSASCGTAALAAARAEYETARGTLEGRLDSIQDTERWRDLVAARLEAIVCTLEALPMRLLHLELRGETARALGDQTSVPELTERLTALEQSAAAALEAAT